MNEPSSRFLSGSVSVLLTLFLVLLVNLAPFALGSNRPLPWAYNAFMAGAVLIAITVWQLTQMRHGASVSLQPIIVPLSLFVLVMVWVGIQVVQLPAGPLSNPIWQVAAGFDGSITHRSISINPMNSVDAAMRLLTYASVFLAVYILASDPDRASAILWIFVCSACFYAIYGLVRYSLDWHKILWFTSPSTRLTGPFLGQNNAATYFGLGVVSALALLLQAFRRTERESRHSSRGYRLIAAFQALSGKAGFLLLIFVVLLVALLLTTSRAGIVATLGGCMTLIALRAVKGRSGGNNGATRFAGLAFVVFLVVIIFEMSGGRFAERVLTSNLDAGGRFDVYRMTWAAISGNAWFGTGFGTFQDVFPVYRDDVLELGLTWDKAHNDYLELFLGLGMPASLMFLLALFLLFTTVLRGYFRRRRDSIYCSIAVAACVVVALHSLVDFSLQIQAVAMAFAMLLGLGAAQSRSRGSAARS
jgi:O-antigen ligase